MGKKSALNERSENWRDRGVPPPPNFSWSALFDDTFLTQKEVASIERKSFVAVQKGRIAGTDGLEWRTIGGFPRCVAGSLKAKLQGDETPVVKAPPRAPEPVRAASTSARRPVGRPRKQLKANQTEGASI